MRQSKIQNPKSKIATTLGAVVCLLAACGCSSFNVKKYLPSLTGKTGEFRTPLKIVAFWTDTVRTSPGQPAMRGFGGRLMFYEHTDGKPVKVAGSLAIYAFDEAHHDSDNPKPDRKFVFPAEQVEKHYSKSELGHSYSFWIPWDPVGGETKQISLICRFSPVQGGAVVSDQVRQLLPGVEPAERQSPTQAAELKVTHRQESLAEPSRPRMDTATIELTGPPELRLPTAVARPRRPWPTASPSAAPVEQADGANVAASQPAAAQAAPSPITSGQGIQAAAAKAEVSGGAVVTYGKVPPRDSSWLARFGPRAAGPDGPDRAPGPWRPTHVARLHTPPPPAVASASSATPAASSP
ncbi:MAG: hypothetical protein B7Z73_01570 [Planctomycetia bacterium 21-64-5]|nr:MAG: hypothetical protein B7Z73_01570 [Planctomycetia bacterium 21-64-5]HQU43449.1 hypothetical protein [Pirellulales bacterium]